MFVHREGSGETARMRRLAWAFACRLCDKYHKLMSLLIANIEWCHNSIVKAIEGSDFDGLVTAQEGVYDWNLKVLV